MQTPKWLGLLLGMLAAVGSVFAGELPAGYTAVDYIESTGTQYLDTRYIHKSTTKVVCVADVSSRQYGTYAAVFGSRNSNYKNNCFVLFARFNGTTNPAWCRTGAETTGSTFPTDKKVEITASGLQLDWKEVDTPANTGSITSTGTNNDGINYLFVFGLNQSGSSRGTSIEDGTRATMKLYSFKIYEDDTLLHDFVPCVSPNGFAGVYDLVDGVFHGNRGTGRFFLPGEGEMLFARGYAETGNNYQQWIDTGYQPVAATRIETTCRPFARNSAWTSLFGVMSNDSSANGVLVRYYNTENSLNGFFCNATYSEAKIGITPNTDMTIVLQSGALQINDTTATITTVNTPYANSLYLGCENNSGTARRHQGVRFYDFKITEGETLKRNFVPARTAANEITLYDTVGSTHYASQHATQTLRGLGELSYLPSGSKLTVYDGKLTVADLADYTSLEKAGLLALDATKVTAFPALTLAGGVVSFFDGVASARTVDGTLALAGGTRLEVDLTASGADSLTATAIELASASAENPVTIAVREIGTVPATARTILAGGLTDADLAKFKLDSATALTLAIADGALTLAPAGVTAALPAGYTQLEYIRANGDGQYINTGYLHTPYTALSCEIKVPEQNRSIISIFGACDNSSTPWRSLEFYAKYGSNGVNVGFNSANEPVSGGNCDLQVANADTFAFGERVTVAYGNGRISWSGGGKSGALESTEASVGVDGETLYIFDSDLLCSPWGRGGDVFLYMFRIYDGSELVRDFVPCLSPRGEPGLYDRIGKKFYANSGSNGRFQTPVEPSVAVQRGAVRSTGVQYLDTGVLPTTETKAELWFNPKAPTTNWSGIFSTMSNDSPANAFTLRYANLESNLNGLFCNANHAEAKIAITPNTDIHAILEKNKLTVNDTEKTITTVNTPYQSPILLFADSNDGTARRYQAMTVYKFILSDNGSVVRTFVPWVTAEGAMGLYDTVGSTFYAGTGTLPLLASGHGFSRDGSTFVLREGTFTADDLADETTFEKAGPFGATVPTLTSCTSLAVTGGALLFDDGTPRTLAVAGTLTLAGDTALAFDVTADGNDAITASALTLAATAEQPVRILITPTAVAELETSRTLISGGALTAADLAKFTLSASIPVKLAIADGNLVLEPKETGSVAWTGLATDGNWSSTANWEDATVPEVGAKVTFDVAVNTNATMDIADLVVHSLTFGANAGAFTFDGVSLGVQKAITNESAQAQTFALPLTLGVAGETFALATDQPMTLTGGVASPAETLVKTGAGEVLIDDTAVAQAGSLDIRAGTVKLNVTGTLTGDATAGEIHIAAGARLDTNVDHGSTEATMQKTGAIYAKTVHVAGDGPDGNGAIYNSNPISHWGATLANLVVDDDASLGGGFFGIRAMTGSAITSRSVTGGHTLTLRNPVQDETTSFNDLTFALQELDVRNSKIQLQGTMSGTITNGIHFFGDSVFSCRAATMPASLPFYIDDGTTTFLAYQTSAYQMPVTVAKDATLTMNTTYEQGFYGPFTVNGTLNKSGANEFSVLGGLTGTGTIVSSASCFSLAGDSDFTGTLDVTGGWLKFGWGTRGVVPKKIPTFNTVAADIHFDYGVSTEIGAEYDAVVAQAAANEKNVLCFAVHEDDALTLKGATWNLYKLGAGNGSSYGNVVIDEGSTVNIANKLYTGSYTSPKNSKLTIKTGGTLNFTDTAVECAIGESGTSLSTHRLIVDGGTLNAPNLDLTIGRDGYDCRLELNDGVLAAKGIQIRRAGSGYNATNHYERLTQTGGVLELGADGFTAPTPQYEDPSINLAGGTLKPTAGFTLAYGTLFTTFGETPTDGTYTIDLNGQTLNWRSALQGWNDVVLRGAGTFTTVKEFQSVPEGNWRVADTQTIADLSGAAGFAGGLTLDADTTATIDIAGEGLVEMGVFTTAEFANFTAVTNYFGPYQNLANTLERLHRYDSTALQSYMYYAYRGEFYVPEDATYYFAGTYDDYLTFEIDGGVVLSSVGKIGDSWQQVVTGSRELSTGWHTFRVAAFDNAGGQGPGYSDWKGVMALGWTTTEPADAKAVANYTRFDTTTLRMRPGLCRWQRKSGNADAYLTATQFNATACGTLDSLTFLRALDDTNLRALCANKTTCRLLGDFYAETAGAYEFTGIFDDRISVSIDGQLLFATTAIAAKSATVTLTAGWHAFDIRFNDGTGNIGHANALVVKKPGAETAVTFDEENFAIRGGAAGLGGTTSLAKGAMLVNRATAGNCPIDGVLAGTGALSGAFAFTEKGAWRVQIASGNKLEATDTTKLANTDFVKNLRQVDLVLAAPAASSRYALCAAGTLTDAEAGEITVTARLADDAATGTTCAQGWSARVVDAKLYLINPKPMGTMIFVR